MNKKIISTLILFIILSSCAQNDIQKKDDKKIISIEKENNINLESTKLNTSSGSNDNIKKDNSINHKQKNVDLKEEIKQIDIKKINDNDNLFNYISIIGKIKSEISQGKNVYKNRSLLKKIKDEKIQEIIEEAKKIIPKDKKSQDEFKKLIKKWEKPTTQIDDIFNTLTEIKYKEENIKRYKEALNIFNKEGKTKEKSLLERVDFKKSEEIKFQKLDSQGKKELLKINDFLDEKIKKNNLKIKKITQKNDIIILNKKDFKNIKLLLKNKKGVKIKETLTMYAPYVIYQNKKFDLNSILPHLNTNKALYLAKGGRNHFYIDSNNEELKNILKENNIIYFLRENPGILVSFKNNLKKITKDNENEEELYDEDIYMNLINLLKENKNEVINILEGNKKMLYLNKNGFSNIFSKILIEVNF